MNIFVNSFVANTHFLSGIWDSSKQATLFEKYKALGDFTRTLNLLSEVHTDGERVKLMTNLKYFERNFGGISNVL